MGTCLDRGIKVVSNAGGLDPAGCAEAVGEVADRLGLLPRSPTSTATTSCRGIDELIRPASTSPTSTPASRSATSSRFVTANAYLGCWGIVEALARGADIVVTGRTTDAAVVCGPAAWHHGWARDDWDALAGAVVAGHVIECGTQATGGNYSFFTEVPGMSRAGFPWAEIAADGSSVIGKHDGTGGEVSIGTVTSQLLYEIGGPAYLGPDVTARFDTIRLEQVAPDRVRIHGVRGEPPPPTLKVAMNELGGYRNDIAVRAHRPRHRGQGAARRGRVLGGVPVRPEDFASVTHGSCAPTRPTRRATRRRSRSWGSDGQGPRRAQGRAGVLERGDRARRWRASRASSASAAGPARPARTACTGRPGPGRARAAARGDPRRRRRIHGRVRGPPRPGRRRPPAATRRRAAPAAHGAGAARPGRRARSGDKGGNANLGVFARTDAAWAWLDGFLTVERLRELLPEAGLPVDRHRLPTCARSTS